MKWPENPYSRHPRLHTAPLSLGQRNVYVFPSRWGFSFGGLILLFLLVSTNYNNNLGFLLAFLLASLTIVSAVNGQHNLAGLTVRPGKSGAVFLGETLPFSVLFKNDRRYPRFALQFGIKNEAATDLPFLGGGDEISLEISVRPQQRGWCNPGVLVLESRFPLGFFRVWSRFAFDWRGLVYPAPASTVKPFPFSSGDSSAGVYSGNDDFSGFRAYQAGDSLRQLHWKNYAKGRELMTRLYHHGGREQLWLDWSLTEEDGVEAKLSRLCRWVLDAEQGGLDYGLRLPNKEIPPSNGPLHRDACLEALALFQT